MRWLVVIVAACGNPAAAPDAGSHADATADGSAAADWVVAVDASASAGHLDPALLGHYDLSGSLFDYGSNASLVSRMKAIGFSDWRVGLGRWEISTRLLPALTDGTDCNTSAFPAILRAPAGATDASLVADRDWFTDTGTPATLGDTADDKRYALGYIDSVLDEATALGATPYVDIDHMPIALSASRTFIRAGAIQGLSSPCVGSWSNHVSNVRPADDGIYAAAVVGLVRRVVEGPAGRAAPYWEIWNEPELGYAWDQSLEQPTGSLNAWFAMAVTTLVQLDAYRTGSSDAHAKALHFGLGSFASAQTAATVIQQFDATPLPNGAHVPVDFVSFHSYKNDPLELVADIAAVTSARAASTSYAHVELALSEWGNDLTTPPSPDLIDQALLTATVLARGATLGLDRAHRSLFYDFIPGVPYSLVHQDGTVNPVYHAYALLHGLIGDGATRLAIAGAPDGSFDAGDGAVLAGKGSDGVVRVLLVNRGSSSRTARIDGAGAVTAVSVFDDPVGAPHAAAPSAVVTVPARAIVLVTL